ncbi:ComEC/Rec2 family competence protein [Clostridium sp. JS66]|uniref:ComEC/Rec2 family competence protein n=1 Tax=Clostridium sp. JS66 TaxID=3064705 RepID=UPI00298DD92B|nr:MBL fold metallo-hydrolase [Clostridium sp. JS66]WPC42357.1 MBL fold metallo-hydrolase [Clostridium sp. JS66]
MKRKLMILFMIIILTTNSVLAKQNRYEVHFLDTGQSDCILIKTDINNYLIDTGASYYSDKILKYLDANEINKIDTVILTHYHDDHYGGLLAIAESKKINKVLLPMHDDKIKYTIYKQLTKKGISVKYIPNNYILKEEKMNLKALTPFKEDKRIENNNSIILQGEIDGINYLFAADCEKTEEEYMINNNKISHCDILKVPHHGLNTSSTEGFLKKASPKIAIITSNGVESPENKALNRISNIGSIVIRTDLQGDIVIKNGNLQMTRSDLSIKIK